MRATVSYLLIAGVLFCPYSCMGEQPEADAAPAAEAGCLCCHEPQDDSANEVPRLPDESDPDCLCHGAVFQSRVECEQSVADDVAYFSCTTLNDRLSNFSGSLFFGCDFSLPCHFPPLSTGRDICALTCALLI